MPSATQFIQADGRVAAQSYRPCHLFGDGDLFGKGVRYSFYIQYAAATIAIWFNLNEDITSARFGLTVVSMALFINLCVNSVADSLVILDWVIVLHLIAFIPGYAMWRPFFHVYIWARAKMYKILLAWKKAEGEELGLQEADALTETYEALASAVFALEVARHYDQEYDEACRQYHSAVSNFLQAASFGDQMSTSISLFQAGQLQTNMDALQTLRSFYISGLEQIYAQYKETAGRRERLAVTAEQRAVELAAFRRQEYAITQMRRLHKSLWRHEKIFLAVTVLTWVAYVCATPWIFFKAPGIGRKEGCDIKLRTLYAPISIDNRAYLIWLRFLACFTVATLAPLGILAAGITLYKGIESRLQDPKPDKPFKKDQKQPSNDASTQGRTIPEPTKEEVEEWSGKVFDDVEQMRKFIYRGIAVPSCIIGLIITAVLVELTIKTNHVDLSKSSITSTSQLLALLIAMFTFVSVLFHSFVEIIVGEENTKEKKTSFVEHVMNLWSKMTKGTGEGQGEDDGDKGKKKEKQKLPEVRAEEGNADTPSTSRHE